MFVGLLPRPTSTVVGDTKNVFFIDAVKTKKSFSRRKLFFPLWTKIFTQTLRVSINRRVRAGPIRLIERREKLKVSSSENSNAFWVKTTQPSHNVDEHKKLIEKYFHVDEFRIKRVEEFFNDNWTSIDNRNISAEDYFWLIVTSLLRLFNRQIFLAFLKIFTWLFHVVARMTQHAIALQSYAQTHPTSLSRVAATLNLVNQQHQKLGTRIETKMSRKNPEHLNTQKL